MSRLVQSSYHTLRRRTQSCRSSRIVSSASRNDAATFRERHLRHCECNMVRIRTRRHLVWSDATPHWPPLRTIRGRQCVRYGTRASAYTYTLSQYSSVQRGSLLRHLPMLTLARATKHETATARTGEIRVPDWSRHVSIFHSGARNYYYRARV